MYGIKNIILQDGHVILDSVEEKIIDKTRHQIIEFNIKYKVVNRFS
jgi:hypothetical protein